MFLGDHVFSSLPDALSLSLSWSRLHQNNNFMLAPCISTFKRAHVLNGRGSDWLTAYLCDRCTRRSTQRRSSTVLTAEPPGSIQRRPHQSIVFPPTTEKLVVGVAPLAGGSSTQHWLGVVSMLPVAAPAVVVSSNGGCWHPTLDNHCLHSRTFKTRGDATASADSDRNTAIAGRSTAMTSLQQRAIPHQ